MISKHRQLCSLPIDLPPSLSKSQTNSRRARSHFPLDKDCQFDSLRVRGSKRVSFGVGPSIGEAASSLQKLHHPFHQARVFSGTRNGPESAFHLKPKVLSTKRSPKAASALKERPSKRLPSALCFENLSFSFNETSSGRHLRSSCKNKNTCRTSLILACDHSQERPNKTCRPPAKAKKEKFKPAWYSELPQGEARALLTPKYSAAQGIPHREPADFRFWVQLMMAGPEHVLLAEKEDYIFQNGRRLVRPYFFEFVSHVSRRWAEQNIVELFSNEFRQRDRQYYFQAVEDGRLQVDGRKVPPSYVLKQGQTVVHFVHRHEPPVMDQPVMVLHSDADVVVVRKPASVPVHPCGQYRKNTVLGILQAEHPELGTLSPIHRLDRLVSGLLIFARNSATADRFRQDITANEVQKEYVARVVGVFPEEPVEANVPLLYDGKEGRSVVELAEELNDPAVIASAMVNGGRSKEAVTRFRRLSTNGSTSIVACQPLTGRTHQIRVHLQYLGHPIANDFLYLYSGPLPEEARKKGGDTTADVAAARGAAKLAAMATVSGSALVGAIRVVVAAKARKAREDEALQKQREGSAAWSGGQQKEVSIQGNRGSSLEKRKDDTAVAGLEALRKQRETAKGNGEGREEGDNIQENNGDTRTEENGVTGVEALGVHPSSNGGSEGVEKSCSNIESVGPTTVNGTQETKAADTDALFEVDPYCTNCPSIGPSGYEEDQEGLWLHCVRYTGKTWSYECPLPNWAKLE